MKRMLDAITQACHLHLLRRRARRRPGPGALVALARALERAGRTGEAMETARRGLRRYPYSMDLQDALRACSERHGILQVVKLERRLTRRPSPACFRELVNLHLRSLDLDAALEAAHRFVRKYPDDARANSILGNVYLQLLIRDHLARDGEAALGALKKAVGLDPGCLTARVGLAQTYKEIGATSKSAMQALVALQIDPNNREAAAIYAAVSGMPPEKAAESELLWDVEENDESWVDCRRSSLPEPRREDILRGVQQLSLMGGVGRVVLSHRGLEVVARNGEAEAPSEQRDVALIALATGFRRTASVCLKRMTLGTVREAAITMKEGLVLAFVAGSSVLLITTKDHPYAKVVSEEARRSLASWTAVHAREEPAGAGV